MPIRLVTSQPCLGVPDDTPGVPDPDPLPVGGDGPVPPIPFDTHAHLDAPAPSPPFPDPDPDPAPPFPPFAQAQPEIFPFPFFTASLKEHPPISTVPVPEHFLSHLAVPEHFVPIFISKSHVHFFFPRVTFCFSNLSACTAAASTRARNEIQIPLMIRKL